MSTPVPPPPDAEPQREPAPLFAAPDGPPPASPDPWSLPVPAAAPPVVPESERLVGYAPEQLLGGAWDPRALSSLAPAAPLAPRDGLAVPAFVLAWLVAPVGVVLGVVAALRARRTGRRGVGLAVAAVVVGLAVSIVVPTLVAPSSEAWARAVGATGSLGEVRGATDAYARQLREGSCLADMPTGSTRRVTVVPCDSAHAARVVAVVPLRGDSWPGEAEVLRSVTDTCRVTAPAGADVVALTPSAAGWRAGDRNGLCLAGATPGA